MLSFVERIQIPRICQRRKKNVEEKKCIIGISFRQSKHLKYDCSLIIILLLFYRILCSVLCLCYIYNCLCYIDVCIFYFVTSGQSGYA